MKIRAGIWIDHREAVVVKLSDAGEEVIASGRTRSDSSVVPVIAHPETLSLCRNLQTISVRENTRLN